MKRSEMVQLINETAFCGDSTEEAELLLKEIEKAGMLAPHFMPNDCEEVMEIDDLELDGYFVFEDEDE